jgi:hypothetical protein
MNLKNTGKMNSNKEAYLILLLWFLSFGAVAQQKYPKVLNYQGDTVMVFRIEQSREMAIRNEKAKECFEIRDILTQETLLKDSVIQSMSVIIKNDQEAKKQYQEIVESKDKQIEIHRNDIARLEDDVKKQKRLKWSGFGLAGLLAVLFIVK